jgi:hypothetical protein
MNCKDCLDNKNGWCKVTNSNKKEDKELKCKYNSKDYMVVKDAKDFLEKMSKELTLLEANSFIENSLEPKSLSIIKIIR